MYSEEYSNKANKFHKNQAIDKTLCSCAVVKTMNENVSEISKILKRAVPKNSRSMFYLPKVWCVFNHFYSFITVL